MIKSKEKEVQSRAGVLPPNSGLKTTSKRMKRAQTKPIQTKPEANGIKCECPPQQPPRREVSPTAPAEDSGIRANTSRWTGVGQNLQRTQDIPVVSGRSTRVARRSLASMQARIGRCAYITSLAKTSVVHNYKHGLH